MCTERFSIQKICFDIAKAAVVSDSAAFVMKNQGDDDETKRARELNQ